MAFLRSATRPGAKPKASPAPIAEKMSCKGEKCEKPSSSKSAAKNEEEAPKKTPSKGEEAVDNYSKGMRRGKKWGAESKKRTADFLDAKSKPKE